MISIDKLLAVRTIVSHANCPDGLASAILLRDALPAADIKFMQYNTKALAELKAEPGLLFCDFSPPADRAEEFLAAGTIVLDHHKTARDVTESFEEAGLGAYADNEGVDRVISGASLAWRHVWRPIMIDPYRSRIKNWASLPYDAWNVASAQAEYFANLAAIRDTWQSDSTRWREACAQAEALMFYPLETWLAVTRTQSFGPEYSVFLDPRYMASIGSRMEIGEVLLMKKDEAVKKAIQEAYRFTTPSGLKVITFNSVSLTSDAAEALGKEVDLVVGFSYKMDGDKAALILSTRGHAGFDCAAFCKSHGGGGHTAAAGCSFKFAPVFCDSPAPVLEKGHAYAAACLNPYEFVVSLLHEVSR